MQLLEYHAEKENKKEELSTFLEQCLEETFHQELSEECKNMLVKNVVMRKQVGLEGNDAEMIAKMVIANVPHDDPEFLRRMSE
jgi:ribosomal protein S3AE